MSKINDFIKYFTKLYITCSCGKKCRLSMYICEHFVTIHAECRNCNKGMSLTENMYLVNSTNIDLIDDLIEDFKMRFNRGEAK